MEQCSCSLWVNLITASSTLLAATIGTWLAYSLPKRWTIKQNRRVALAIMKTFLAEIQTGLAIFESARRTGTRAQLPNRAWTTYADKLSIPIIDACLQCRGGTSQGGQNSAEAASELPISDFLQHLKNYYEYILQNAQQLDRLNQTQRDDLLTSARTVEQLLAHLVRELEQ